MQFNHKLDSYRRNVELFKFLLGLQVVLLEILYLFAQLVVVLH